MITTHVKFENNKRTESTVVTINENKDGSINCKIEFFPEVKAKAKLKAHQKFGVYFLKSLTE